MRNILFILGLIYPMMLFLYGQSALAADPCSKNSTHGNWYMNIFPPSSIKISAAPVGGVLSRYVERDDGGVFFVCRKGVVFNFKIGGFGLESTGRPGVYKTAVKGVGLRLGASTNYSAAEPDIFPPWQYITKKDGELVYAPKAFFVDFIRLESEVGVGAEVPIKFPGRFGYGMEYSDITYNSLVSTTKVVNGVYFTSCKGGGAAVNVQMGKEAISNVKSGFTNEKNFNFNVSCTGVKSGSSFPVKIYFEGNSPEDGVLRLSGEGQSGNASGIGISLVNNQGEKLPFDRKRSIKTDWIRTEGNSEVYKFSGKAKYILTGGATNPGQANATMTYVLDYD
ncbi:fimbrial protein [Pseudomonas chlororaphis]